MSREGSEVVQLAVEQVVELPDFEQNDKLLQDDPTSHSWYRNDTGVVADDDYCTYCTKVHSLHTVSSREAALADWELPGSVGQ